MLLTADDSTAAERLTLRESGPELHSHIERSGARARELAKDAPATVHRLSTDRRTVDEVAADVLAITGWLLG